MEAEEAIRTRRSIRSYHAKPVEGEKIERILEAARWAPSAGNLQSVEYIVVKSPETRELLSKAALGQDHVREAAVDIVVCCNFSKISHYGSRGKELYSLQESGACIQNMMLVAHGLGLGTCWIGAFDEAKVRRAIGAPQDVKPVAIITVGYAAEKPKSDRKGQTYSVFKEAYGKV
jgi:nitroreductase